MNSLSLDKKKKKPKNQYQSSNKKNQIYKMDWTISIPI